MALAREELGAVHAAGFDADEDAAGGGGGDGNGFELEDFGPAGGVHDCCAHCFGHGAGGGGEEAAVEGGRCWVLWGGGEGLEVD